MSVKHTNPDSLHAPNQDLVAALEEEECVYSADPLLPWGTWEKPTHQEAIRIAAVAQRHTAAELRRLADIVPVGPARTILLNEADRIEGAQR